MSLPTHQMLDIVSVTVYLGGVLFLMAFMLGVPVWLGGRNRGRAKTEPFESGIVAVGSARLRLSVKFYLVVMFFVIFDVEALFLYAWAIAVREAGWPGFWTALVFVAELLAGLWYLVQVGALDWSPAQIRHRRGQSGQGSASPKR